MVYLEVVSVIKGFVRKWKIVEGKNGKDECYIRYKCEK